MLPPSSTSFPQDRANTLANGLFGLYVDPRRTAVIADNVRQLWPLLWEFVDEDTRLNYGVRHARYLASVDTDQATAARELIDLVDGTSYLTEQPRAPALDPPLAELSQAHTGWTTFSNEVAPARQAAALVVRGNPAVATPGEIEAEAKTDAQIVAHLVYKG